MGTVVEFFNRLDMILFMRHLFFTRLIWGLTLIPLGGSIAILLRQARKERQNLIWVGLLCGQFIFCLVEMSIHYPMFFWSYRLIVGFPVLFVAIWVLGYKLLMLYGIEGRLFVFKGVLNDIYTTIRYTLLDDLSQAPDRILIWQLHDPGADYSDVPFARQSVTFSFSKRGVPKHTEMLQGLPTALFWDGATLYGEQAQKIGCVIVEELKLRNPSLYRFFRQQGVEVLLYSLLCLEAIPIGYIQIEWVTTPANIVTLLEENREQLMKKTETILKLLTES